MEISGNKIIFNEHLTISFQRTLRIPDDNKTYPLPPGMGLFPIYKVKDYLETVPKEWIEFGGEDGVFIPMYQKEALWVMFGGAYWHPSAVAMGIGKVNVITGETWSADKLSDDPQNYMVAPEQPWIDGIKSGAGTIRQFVAMPLGKGYTVEAQVTGEEKYGGIQLVVFKAKEGKFSEPKGGNWSGPNALWTGSTACSGSSLFSFDGDSISLQQPCSVFYNMSSVGSSPTLSAAPQASSRGVSRSLLNKSLTPDTACVDNGEAVMGLAAGGKMKQKLYPDRHGIDTWNQTKPPSIFVHICNSVLFEKITGIKAPESPISAATYTQYGYPWFDLYDEHKGDLKASKKLVDVKSVNEIDHNPDEGFNVNDNQIHHYKEEVKWV
jgi:hypothetical protein